MKTIRTFSNDAEAEFAQSLLVSVGIAAVLIDENVNALGPGFAPGGVRLQVPEEDVERAVGILAGGQEEFTPMPEDFVPSEVVPADSVPPRLEGFGNVRGLLPAGLCILGGMIAVVTLYMVLAPLSWTHSSADLIQMGNAADGKKNYATLLDEMTDALAYYQQKKPYRDLKK